MGCNLVLNFLFIPPYGINGAALSSSIFYGVTTVILLLRFHALTGVPYREMLVIKRSDIKQITKTLRLGNISGLGR